MFHMIHYKIINVNLFVGVSERKYYKYIYIKSKTYYFIKEINTLIPEVRGWICVRICTHGSGNAFVW